MSVTITAILAASLSTAMAQSSQAAPSRLDALLACQNIEIDSERVTCFDAQISAFSDAVDSGAVVVVEQEAVRAVERESFGLALPSVGALVRALQPGRSGQTQSEPEQSDLAEALDATSSTSESAETSSAASNEAGEATVTYRNDGRIGMIEGLAVRAVRRDAHEKLIVTLENGQVWRQTSSSRVQTPRRREMDELTASIRSAAMGSFVMRLSHNSVGFRVRRTE